MNFLRVASLAVLSVVGCTSTTVVTQGSGDSSPGADESEPGDTSGETRPGASTGDELPAPVSGTFEAVALDSIWNVRDVWVVGPKDVYAVSAGNGAVSLFHYDGNSFTDQTYSGSASDFFGVPGGALLAYGENIYARQGSDWAEFPQAMGPGAPDVTDSIWGTSDNNLYAVTGHGYRHFDGAGWSEGVPGVEGASLSFNDSFFGTAKDDVYLSDRNKSSQPSRTPKLFHFDGTSWTDVYSDLPDSLKSYPADSLYSMFGTAKDDVWGLSKDNILVHFDGSEWKESRGPSGCALTSGWASAKNNAWLVGKGGCALHWDGKAWTEVETNTALDLYAVHGSDARNVWIAASSKDTVLHLVPDSQ